MNKTAKYVEDSLLKNIVSEFETLLAQYENKETEIILEGSGSLKIAALEV